MAALRLRAFRFWRASLHWRPGGAPETDQPGLDAPVSHTHITRPPAFSPPSAGVEDRRAKSSVLPRSLRRFRVSGCSAPRGRFQEWLQEVQKDAPMDLWLQAGLGGKDPTLQRVLGPKTPAVPCWNGLLRPIQSVDLTGNSTIFSKFDHGTAVPQSWVLPNGGRKEVGVPRGHFLHGPGNTGRVFGLVWAVWGDLQRLSDRFHRTRKTRGTYGTVYKPLVVAFLSGSWHHRFP